MEGRLEPFPLLLPVSNCYNRAQCTLHIPTSNGQPGEVVLQKCR